MHPACSHADAMDNKASYFARDRLVELLTGIKIDHNLEYEDTSGTPLPSFSDRELQKKLDAVRHMRVEIDLLPAVKLSIERCDVS